VAQFTVTAEDQAFRLKMKHGETTLSQLSVIPFRQRIGSAWVRMGGVAGVSTPPQYRLQNHARELLEATVQWMTDEGFHWSGLFGIPNFYNRFGYVTALPESHLSIATRYAEAAKLRHSIRGCREEDLQAVLAIYNETNARRTGIVERAPERWQGFRRSTSWGAVPAVDVAANDGGAVQGYVVYTKYADNVDVAEIAARSLPVYESLAAHLAHLAISRRSENIKVRVPQDHPFAHLCTRLGCTQTTTYHYRRGAMYRLLNPLALFDAISDELSLRLSEAGWQGSCLIDICTELGSVSLHIQDHQVDVDRTMNPAEVSERTPGYRIHVTQGQLTQALTGFVPLRESLEALCHEGELPYESISFSETEPSGASGALPQLLADLCDTLFPRQMAVLWSPDHF
jgi:GNAT superfamily N-acetyltransferase